MTGKRSGSVVCVLPHDSVLSALEGEQREFRALLSALGTAGASDDVPFSFLPPLLSYPENGIPGTIAIGSPVAVDGWIVRPASGLAPGKAIDPPPGYPPLPAGAHVVLGYAGRRAREILDGRDAAAPSESAAATVLRVWRKTTLNYDFEADGDSLSCRYSFEGEAWERAGNQ